ncbi:MAG: J domain-containing protein [Pirellulales bacterium]
MISSCARCGLVHTYREQTIDSLRVICRGCGTRTDGPRAIRNWSVLLAARAAAELAAIVALADGALNDAERTSFSVLAAASFSVDGVALKYVEQHFLACSEQESYDLLVACAANSSPELLWLILAIGVSVAKADGKMNEAELAKLRDLAQLLGFDPNQVFSENGAVVNETSARPWHEVLGVASSATLDEVMSAYRRLAMQFHPDIWAQASQCEQAAALSRMKELNAALERAKQELCARDEREAAAAAKRREEDRQAATAKRREEERQAAAARHEEELRAAARARQREEERKAAAMARQREAEQRAAAADPIDVAVAITPMPATNGRKARGVREADPIVFAIALCILFPAVALIGLAILMQSRFPAARARQVAASLPTQRSVAEEAAPAAQAAPVALEGRKPADGGQLALGDTSTVASDDQGSVSEPKRDEPVAVPRVPRPRTETPQRLDDQRVYDIAQWGSDDHVSGHEQTADALLFGKGASAFFSRDYAGAEEWLTSSITRGTRDPRCFYFRGLIYLRMGRPQEAEVDFRRGSQLEAADSTIRYNVGVSLERIQGAERAKVEAHRRLRPKSG